MKTAKFIMPLALLFCVAFWGQVGAKNVVLLHDGLGIPFSRSYIQQQRQLNLKAHRQFNSNDVWLMLPSNVSGYDNWYIEFQQGGEDVATYTTNSSTDGLLGQLPDGSYTVAFTCYDYYMHNFDIQAYWYVDNTSDLEYTHFDASNAYYSPVYLYRVQVTNVGGVQLQIDGGY
jgi:hypothetical protein